VSHLSEWVWCRNIMASWTIIQEFMLHAAQHLNDESVPSDPKPMQLVVKVLMPVHLPVIYSNG